MVCRTFGGWTSCDARILRAARAQFDTRADLGAGKRRFIGAHPLIVEIAAIGGTVYVRDGGIAICFGPHMLPPSREDEKIVVIEGKDRSGRPSMIVTSRCCAKLPA